MSTRLKATRAPSQASSVERALREAVAGQDGGIWEWDITTDALHWEPRIYALLGLDPAREPTTAARFFDRLHPDDRAALEANQRRHIRDHTPQMAQYRLRHADGRWLWFDSRGQSVVDGDGRPARVVGFMRDISDAVATQRALEASERRFADLTHSIPGAVLNYVMTADGVEAIEYMSLGCRAIWDVAPEDVVSDPGILWRTVHPEDLGAMQASVLRSRDTMTVWEHRWRITTPGGDRRWLEARGAPSRRPDGAVSWSTVVLDVTAQERATQALAASEARLNDIAETFPGVIYQYRLHPDGQDALEYVSPGCAAMWGVPVEEAMRSTAPIWARVAPDDRTALERSVAASARDLSPWEQTVRYDHPSGAQIVMELRGQPRRHADGSILWTSVAFDVTERRRAELALARSERRFADIAASVPGVIYRYVVSPDGRHAIDDVSPHCRQVWGVEPGAVLRDVACVWDRLHPEDVPAAEASIAQSAETLEEWRARYRIVTQDGRIKTIEGRGMPRREADGTVIWNSVAFDVTERAEAEAAAAAALAEAEAANHAKSLFLATMSHEIRTPMNGVSGMAALLANTALDDRQREMLQVLQNSTVALLDIVNTVLDYSRIDVSGVQLTDAPFDLRRLSEDVAALCEARIDPARVRVTLDVAPAVEASVTGDANKLRQVLVNLTSNAAKFTDDGEIALRIDRDADGAMRMVVSDTGPGIAADKLEAIFEPFTQGDQSATRRHAGAGLGLAIARRIARAMGGDLVAASRLGRGSDFVLTAPLPPATDQPRTEVCGG